MLQPNPGFYYFLEFIKPYIDFKSINTIFDIGAREAHESLFFEKEFSNSKIFAFEPNPFQYNICLDEIKDSKNISVINKALSNFNGTSKFYLTPGNIGASSLLKPNFVPWTGDQQIKEIQVDVITLDDFCKENPTPDIIWMDVQGNELYTLQGGKKSLESTKAIYCEAGVVPYYENHSLKHDIIKFLEDNNFKLIDDKLDWSHETNLIFVK